MLFNNRSIKRLSISRLLELNIHKPNIQRIIDNDKINTIIDYQLSHIKNKGYPNFFGTINIHKLDKDLYLVDGQHRFESSKKLLNEYSHDIDLTCEFVTVDTMDELITNYNIINKNTPLPDFPEHIDKNIPEKVGLFFKDKYPNNKNKYWSDKSRTKRPLIYFNFFQESLAFLTDKLKIKNENQLIQIIEEYNKNLLNYSKDKFDKDVKDHMYQKALDNKFMLGLFKHESNSDYGYKWVSNIITYQTGEIIKSDKVTKKRRIPKKVRDDLWDTYIGNTIAEASCIVCNNSKISSRNFDAGHIISEHNGGSEDISNLLPICKGCNLSMGTTDMNKYVKQYYPIHYNQFINKKYL